MIALVRNLSTPKAFLVEEWINTDNGNRQFIKYLNNRVPHHISDSVPQAPKAWEITDFLIFAQHIQWKKSHYLAFTSDYQGAGDLLTDPQIMSNLYVSLVYVFYSIILILYQHSWKSIWRWKHTERVQRVPQQSSMQSLLQVLQFDA